MNSGTHTRFTVTTRVIPHAEAGLASAAEVGDPSVVWARGDEWLLGFGIADRLEFTGPDRVRDAASAWRELLAASTVDDDVQIDGSGLIAFGTFAFADTSTTTSVLVIPRRVVGRRRGVTFVTEVLRSVDGAGNPADSVHRHQHEDDAHALGRSNVSMDQAAYEAAVADAVAHIRAGSIEKVVLARDIVAQATPGFDLEGPLRILRSRYRDAWTFAVDGFFGASPETLIASDGTAVTARVLAGTASRESDPTRDAAARAALEASIKDRFEHALAVDSLVLTLGPSVDELVVGRRFALELPNVWHLATDVTAHLIDGSTALDLVAALHPTAAVAGVPRAAAIGLIEQLEPFDRGRYAGPVGWVGAHGSGEWAIGLRSAQLAPDGGIRAFAGAGIVDGSDPATEFVETGWKFAPILEALGLPAISAGALPPVPGPQPVR